MCWMCVECEQSSYRACDGCSNLIEKRDLYVYDILREWKHLAEFIEQKQRVMIFCSNCTEAMNAYRESTRAHVAETEPSALYLPEPREIDRSDGAIPVGTHNVAYETTLGIRCAKRHYGCDAVEDILQGFIYHDDTGHQIKRLTLDDVDETICCERCWRALW